MATITAATGFFASGSTFADAIGLPSDATFVKVFSFDQGGFLTEGAEQDTAGDWIRPADLANIDFSSGRYAVKAFGPETGQTSFVDGRVQTDAAATSFVEAGDETLAANAEIALDEVVDTSSLRDVDFVNVIVQQDGETVADTDFVSPGELAGTSFNTGDDGTTTEIFVDTFISGSGQRTGFTSNQVTADASIEPPDNGDGGGGGEANTFTLQTVEPEVDKEFVLDGADFSSIEDLLESAGLGDEITTEDGDVIFEGGDGFGSEFVGFLTNLAENPDEFISETVNFTFPELTTTGSNEGVVEGGATSDADNRIVAPHSGTLHGARIDGGGGENTLVVEMKGVFAQPELLANIQNVEVQNVANFYGDDILPGFSGETDGNDNNSNQDGAFAQDPLDEFDPSGANEDRSILDLSRANDLENLTITESSVEGTGDLTVLGIKNGATARLEGSFSESVVLHYGPGQGTAIDLELANVSVPSQDLGDDNGNGDLLTVHDAQTLNLAVEGTNELNAANLGANLNELNVSGEGSLRIENELTLDADRTAVVDASANTGGVTLGVDNNAIDITGSAGDDVFTVQNSGGQLPTTAVNVDTGAGNDTVVMDTGDGVGLLTREGSVVTGDNVTVQVSGGGAVVAQNVDLSGVAGVEIRRDTTLSVTQQQVAALGVGAFEAFNGDLQAGLPGTQGRATLAIEINQDTDFSDLVDPSALGENVQVGFNVNQGAELTLTAEQLHKYVASPGLFGEGVSVGPGEGAVVNIVDAGTGFDADSQQGTGGGTVGAFNGKVNVERTFAGFERPEPADDMDTLTITADGEDAVVVPEGELNEPGVNDDQIGTLLIEGSQDVVFEGRVDLAEGFTLDFSEFTGSLDGLTIENFQDITPNATTGSAEGEGEIIGNGNENARINLSLNGQVGFDDNAVGGFNTQGVPTYVVTDLNGDDREVFLSDSSQGIDTLGLQGNSGNTLEYSNVNFGTDFLLEGDGFGDFSELSKAEANPNESNIGTLDADFFFPGANATVTITNQGTNPGDTSQGNPRPIVVDGLNVDNAGSLTVNVEDGNARIESLDGELDAGGGFEDGDGFESVTFTSSNDLTVVIDDSAEDHQAFDASGVGGTFTFEVEDGGDVDLADKSLSGIDAIAMQDGSEATLTAAQIQAVSDAEGFSVLGGDDATATLNVGGLGESEFSAAALGLPDSIELGTVTVADQDEVTLNANTDLSGVDELIVPANTTLNLSAEQYRQIEGSAGTKISVEGDASTGDAGTVNITGLTDDQVLQDTDGDGVDEAIDLSAIDAANTNSDAADVQGTITLGADTVTLSGGPSEPTTVLEAFGIDLGEGQEIRLATDDQAHERVITGPDSSNARVAFRFPASQVTTSVDFDEDGNTLDANETPALDLSGYSNLNQLEVLSTLVEGNNVEQILGFLDDAIEVDVVSPADADDPIADKTNRDVVVESGVSVASDTVTGDSLIFEDLTSSAEVETLNLDLLGDTEINGAIDISALTGIPVGGSGFQTLTINSEGDNPNLIGEDDGTSVGGLGDSIRAGLNNLFDVDINASQDLTIEGNVAFTSATVEDATAELDVTGSGDVTIGSLETGNGSGEAVTNLEVTNSGSGTLTVTGASSALNIGASTDTVTLAGSSAMSFGQADDPSTMEEEFHNGLSAPTGLTTLDASGLSGSLDLGVLSALPDGSGDGFTFTSNTGETSLTLGGPLGGPGVELNAAGGDPAGWTFDLTGAASGSSLTLGSPEPEGSGTRPTFTSGPLNLNLGSNATLVAALGTDFTGLDADPTSQDGELSVSDNATIELAEGATVSMTDDQFNALNGASFTGDRTLDVDFSSLDTAEPWVTAGSNVDLTQVRGLTGVNFVNALNAGFVELTAEQAASATVDPDGAGTGADAGSAGDLTEIDSLVFIEANGATDTSDLVGIHKDVTSLDDALDQITVDVDGESQSPSALTVRDTQLGALENGLGGGDGIQLTDLNKVSSLTVVSEVQTGVDGATGDPEFSDLEIDVALTKDGNGDVTSIDVSGNAGGIEVARNGSSESANDTEDQAAFTDLLNNAASVTHEFVGSPVSVERGPLTGTAASDSFVFSSNPVTGSGQGFAGTSGPVQIDGFTTGTDADELDFTNLGATAEQDVQNPAGSDISNIALTSTSTVFAIDTDADDLTETDADGANGNAPITDFTDTTQVANFIGDGGTGEAFDASGTNGDTNFFVINDGDTNDAFVYRHEEANGDAAITADEVDLIGDVTTNGGIITTDDIALA